MIIVQIWEKKEIVKHYIISIYNLRYNELVQQLLSDSFLKLQVQ